MSHYATHHEGGHQIPHGHAADKPYIEFNDVSKSFGSRKVLDGVSFNVLPAETLCILGRSGVGKSVSLHHIMGFLKPDSGRVHVAYEDITDYDEPELQRIRRKVTMVFQNGALFDSLTVGENVAFPLRERRDLSEYEIYQIVDGLLEMVGVKQYRDLLPSDLSTGMKRSVAIARARSAHGQPPGRPHLQAQAAAQADQRGSDARHAPGKEAGRSAGVPARSEGDFLRDCGRDGAEREPDCPRIPRTGRRGARRPGAVAALEAFAHQSLERHAARGLAAQHLLGVLGDDVNLDVQRVAGAQ